MGGKKLSKSELVAIEKREKKQLDSFQVDLLCFLSSPPLPPPPPPPPLPPPPPVLLPPPAPTAAAATAAAAGLQTA